ncbi:MAG: response regulator [Phycisphaerae bacterium]
MPAKKILIIDDDPDSVTASRCVLESQGYEILSASDPTEALAAAKSIKPDLLILDVMMVHETDGFHLARTFKDDPATAKIPILMMTSIGKKRDFVFEGTQDNDYLPVDDFLEKPAPPEALKKSVAKLIGK